MNVFESYHTIVNCECDEYLRQHNFELSKNDSLTDVIRDVSDAMDCGLPILRYEAYVATKIINSDVDDYEVVLEIVHHDLFILVHIKKGEYEYSSVKDLSNIRDADGKIHLEEFRELLNNEFGKFITNSTLFE